MPNWCGTHYYFCGDKHELDKLEQVIKEATSGTYNTSDFGKNWLGNVLCAIGLENKTFDIPCRGTIDAFDRQTVNGYDCLSVITSTAWVYTPEPWREVLKKFKLTSIKTTFYAEEPNDDLYTIYDPYNLNIFTDTHHITHGTNDGEEYFMGDDNDTVDELTSIITKITGKPPKSQTLSDLIEEAYELDNEEDNYVWIVEIDRIIEPIFES